MGCNSDYMKSSQYELELSHVACLLDEFDGKKTIDDNHWNGYHPKVYGVGDVDGDKMVAKLCKKLQSATNVASYSLEMQIWWRDHKNADRKRLRAEIKSQKTKKEKASAIAKLTPHERKILASEVC